MREGEGANANRDDWRVHGVRGFRAIVPDPPAAPGGWRLIILRFIAAKQYRLEFAARDFAVQLALGGSGLQ